MRRAAKLLPAIAALFFMGACSTAEAQAVHGDARDDLGWVAVADSGRTNLLFGVADSDQIFFGLSCSGAGRVAFADYSLSPEDARRGALTLVSGEERALLPVRSEVDDTFAMGTGELPANAPVLAAFRRTGRLGMPGGKDGYSAATGAELAQIERFFRACSARA
jgi:hypothetical protein